MQKPKIRVWDIETAHNIVATFQLFNKHAPINYDNILQERYIICASWKELGTDEVHSTSVLDFKHGVTNDLGVVKALHNMLSDSDAVIAHYGDEFDMKYFQTRCIFHNLLPIPNIIQIDTRKIAKSKFLFNVNRLDYLGKFLGVGEKIKTDNELWLQCLHGNAAAIEEMISYNRQDVELLERVYNRLAPFVPAHVNYKLFAAEDRDSCKHCGSAEIQYRGYALTKANKYRRYQCQLCGAWDKSDKAEKKNVDAS